MQSGGLRMIFRYVEGVGYYVLEAFPGRLILKRNNLNAPVLPLDDNSRAQEWIFNNISAPIQGNAWYNVTIWVEGSRIFVYLNGDLLIDKEDLQLPQLGAGQIIMQANNAFRPVRLDDIIIQRAEPPSDHFQAANLPRTWQTTSTTNSTIEREGNDNQYIRMAGVVTVNPVMSPIRPIRRY